MIGLVALDFVLGIVFRGVMRMTLVVEILGVDGDDRPRYPACLGIPAYVIADLEDLCHCDSPQFAAFRGTQRNELVDSYRLRTMWVAWSVA